MKRKYLNEEACREIVAGFGILRAICCLNKAEENHPTLGTIDSATNVNWCRALQERIEELS